MIGKGLIDGGCSGHGFTAEVDEHVFDDHENHHFILDNEDASTGSDLSFMAGLRCRNVNRAN
jgi:hypothetical protein